MGQTCHSYDILKTMGTKVLLIDCFIGWKSYNVLDDREWTEYFGLRSPFEELWLFVAHEYWGLQYWLWKVYTTNTRYWKIFVGWQNAIAIREWKTTFGSIPDWRKEHVPGELLIVPSQSIFEYTRMLCYQDFLKQYTPAVLQWERPCSSRAFPFQVLHAALPSFLRLWSMDCTGWIPRFALFFWPPNDLQNRAWGLQSD